MYKTTNISENYVGVEKLLIPNELFDLFKKGRVLVGSGLDFFKGIRKKDILDTEKFFIRKESLEGIKNIIPEKNGNFTCLEGDGYDDERDLPEKTIFTYDFLKKHNAILKENTNNNLTILTFFWYEFFK